MVPKLSFRNEPDGSKLLLELFCNFTFKMMGTGFDLWLQQDAPYKQSAERIFNMCEISIILLNSSENFISPLTATPDGNFYGNLGEMSP